MNEWIFYISYLQWKAVFFCMCLSCLFWAGPQVLGQLISKGFDLKTSAFGKAQVCFRTLPWPGLCSLVSEWGRLYLWVARGTPGKSGGQGGEWIRRVLTRSNSADRLDD